MRTILYLILLLPLWTTAQEGRYYYKDIRPGGTSATYKLTLSKNNKFTITCLEDQIDYSYEDTLYGNWKLNKDTIRFFDIDQPKFILKSTNTELSNKTIQVIEECVYSYTSPSESKIAIIVIDNNFRASTYIKPISFKYVDEKIYSVFNIPENCYQIIYFNRSLKPLEQYFYGGINLVKFQNFNSFKISNCGKTMNQPVKFFNPIHEFILLPNGQLKSILKRNDEFLKFKKST